MGRKKAVVGIPTAYRGIHFRSRLEATWAAFFDGLKIEWKYEPLDLKGYIPDFAIFEGATLVEVKPALTMHELWGAVEKVEASGWTGHTLIVGAAFPLSQRWLGLGGEEHSWGYAQIEHLSTGLKIAEAAWIAARNETQWFPGSPARRTRKRPEPGNVASAMRVEMAEACKARWPELGRCICVEKHTSQPK